jgi:hypothetical protein
MRLPARGRAARAARRSLPSRALVYLFGPVPIAVLTIFAWLLLESGKQPAARDLADWPRVVLAGYFFMGVQSAVLAVLMWRLEPRACAVRLLAGVVLGALLGATMGIFLPQGQWHGPVLGAPSGLLTALLADVLAARRTAHGGRA